MIEFLCPCLQFVVTIIFFSLCSSTRTPCSEQESEIPVNENPEESLEPIQFESQNDITDEDLQKYLEELEELEDEEEDKDKEELSEEKEDQEFVNKPNEKENETEVKPVRPGFLDLNESKSDCLGPPGQTPLPKDIEQAEVVFSDTPR